MKHKENIPSDWATGQFDFYQSANSDNRTIKENFVIRVAEFELIIADLRNKKIGDPLQHELILGRRGSGKSTLLKRIQIEIDEDPELASKYIAINLAEEQAGIYRLFDLWMEVLKELSHKLEFSVAFKEYSFFSNEHSYTNYLYDEIHKVLIKNKKKVVLLLDNIDRILENFQEDGNLLREILLNYDDLQIIGGSTWMDEHFWRYDKPFYEFFRRHRLEALSIEETYTLLAHWSEVMNLPQLNAFVKNNPGKIEAVRILTDGLPRTLQFFIQILLRDSTLYGFDYIRKIMDKVTPLYQERLNHLPPPQRKIVLEMAFLWEACSVKQLAEKCHMKGKLLSAQLQRLSNANIAETIATSNKNHLYRISERFFNMWLIITQGNPDQKRKAKWLSVFLETWYDSTQLKALVLEHIKNLRSKKMTYDRAVVLTKAFSQLKYISTTQRDEMLDFTTELNSADLQIDFLELPKKYKEIRNEIDRLRKENRFLEAHKLADGIENEDDGIKFSIQGSLFHQEGKNREAEMHYLRAVEMGNTSASYNLANIYVGEGKYSDANIYYKQAIKKGHVNSLNNLGVLYFKMRENREAEKYYFQAIEKGNIRALFNLANLYASERENAKAEKYFLLAIEKGHVGSLNNLANLYYDLSEYEKAEVYYLQAIEKGLVNALFNLAYFYYQNYKNRKEALQLIEKYKEQGEAIDVHDKIVQLLIELWNGVFENVEEKMLEIIKNSNYESLDFFIKELLVHEQTYMVLNLFHDQIHGKNLQERYALLYYIALLLTVNDSNDNLKLRIPPEVMSTVLNILEEIKEEQAHYSKF